LPVFDPDGKYLYYSSGRAFNPLYSDLDETWIYANSFQLVAVPLRKDVPSPLAPRNDDEGQKKSKDKEKVKDKDQKKPDTDKPKKDEPKLAIEEKEKADSADKADAKDKSAEDKDDKKEEKPPKPV